MLILDYSSAEHDCALECELKGVSNEVDEHLLDSLDVYSQLVWNILIAVHDQLYPLLFSLQLEHVNQLTDLFSEIDYTFVFGEFTVLNSE